MKKLYTTIIVVCSIISSSYAQWTHGTGIIYPTILTDKVGIGTTTPAEKLDIEGNIKLNGNLTFAHDQTEYFIHPAGNGGAIRLRSNVSANSDRNIQFGNIDNAGSWNSFMTINDDGRIGIGTTSPLSNLQIGSLSATASTSPVILSLGATYSSAHGLYPKLKLYDNGINFWGLGISQSQLDYIVDASNYDHVFYAAGAELMRIQGTGNVAIGTSDPHGYKLAINGSAIATSMTVKLYATWPDYVFKKDYKLPSLLEVKTYIDKNQRLPEMPSEQEVRDNGINLGNMMKLQMKKIEELTLYAIELKEENAQLKIEQQKKIDEQEARIAILEKAISKTTFNK